MTSIVAEHYPPLTSEIPRADRAHFFFAVARCQDVYQDLSQGFSELNEALLEEDALADHPRDPNQAMPIGSPERNFLGGMAVWNCYAALKDSLPRITRDVTFRPKGLRDFSSLFYVDPRFFPTDITIWQADYSRTEAGYELRSQRPLPRSGSSKLGLVLKKAIAEHQA